jgi:hypothetical protein
MSPSAKLDRGAFPEYFPDETRTLLKQPQRHYWFAAFFAFGAMMCLLTTVLLVFPGTKLDSLWNLNPDAHVGFQSLGSWSIVLLVVVGAGCALAAIGLWRATNWGVQLAVAILFCNIIGDLVNAFMRRDYRSLVGLPIAGAMIFYLVRLNTAAKGIESRAAALINLKRVLRDQTEGLAPSKRARSEIFPRDRRKLDW